VLEGSPATTNDCSDSETDDGEYQENEMA